MSEKLTDTSYGGVSWGKKWGKPRKWKFPERGMYIILKQIDECYYCGAVYHPMMNWTKGNQLICVCSVSITGNTCAKDALEEGWSRRRDLTPSR